MSDLALALLLATAILIASMVSVEVALSAALLELAGGVIVGNVFTVTVPDWLTFIGSFAGVVLTFLAGAEVDVPQLRREWRASASIGVVSFGAPFVVALVTCHWLAGWNRGQSEIGGLALSTTSLAVVYAVLVESGLNRSVIGKRIMSATFVTDILTVLGLSVLFIKPNLWIVAFVAASVAAIWGLPRLAPWFFGRYGDRVIEPEIKLVFAILFALMYLGGKANSQAALPVFVLGLAMGGHYAAHRREQERTAGGRVRLPDAVLLPQGRPERVAPGRVLEPGRARPARGREDDPEVRRRLPARAPLHRAPRRLHDAADEHRADVRHDHLALRPPKWHHRPYAVLAPDLGGGAVGDHPDGDRPALLPAAGDQAGGARFAPGPEPQPAGTVS